MLSKYYKINIFKKRLVLFLITTALFIAAFVLNVKMNQPLYNVNLNEVPIWQNNSSLGNHSFLTFMNVMSTLFSPILCAAYIFLFFLISYRKLQVLVFLIWFIFLSWILSLLKMIFHQARPYWIQQSGIKMLQWTCYTQYGMPSGHSMMAIILMQFIVRFFSRINKCMSKSMIAFYILIIILHLLVMFSRVILGMHALNQVLFGCLIGCYSFIPYYLFIQRYILKFILSIFKSQKSIFNSLTILCITIFVLVAEILIALLITYNNDSYILAINSFQGCDGFKLYKSFQYKCLQDSALIMAVIGILVGFNFMRNPSHLYLQVQYSKCSIKFIGKFIITLIIPVIIVAIFLNPLWQQIPVNTLSMSLIIWACQVIGFYLATFTLICFIPNLNSKFKLQLFKIPQNYQQFIQYQSLEIYISDNFRLSHILVQKKRQTQLTQTDRSIKIKFKIDQNQRLNL